MAQGIEIEQADRDERLGEAVEIYLELVESGTPPDPEDFVSEYPDLGDELREALAGLSLVQGLVGSTGGGGRGKRLEVGRRLAGYRIAGELGAGGMGVVYEAVHVDLDRPVALKVLDARFTRDGSTGLRRFLNEARTAAALHHTNIVPVFDVGHVGGLCYYAMQRIEGSGLDRVIKTLRKDRSTGAGSGSGRSTPAPGRFPTSPRGGDDLSGLIDPSATGTWLGSGVACTAADRAQVAAPTFEPPRGSGYYRWVAEVGRVAAQAMAFAHGRGVIHRDVKPSNILIDSQGTIWVADFGLARRLDDPARPAERSDPALAVFQVAEDSTPTDGRLTRTDGLIGTPRYMSPEQSRSAPVDLRTDVYGLGATLYELLALRPPFEARTTAELIEQINTQEPTPLRQIDSRIPRDLEAIVHKALAKRPADRYRDAGAMSADLARFLAYEPVQARPIGVPGRALRMALRHPAASLVATVATVMIVAITSYAYLRILNKHNVAVKAEQEMLIQRNLAVQAEQATRSALREQKLSQAQVVLAASTRPNRREEGLKLLREAAAMEPGAGLRARLQAEAIEFLALRDVRRQPDLAIGRSVGLAFGPASNRLAVAPRSGEPYAVWSLETRSPVSMSTAATEPVDERRDHRDWLGTRLGSRLATAGELGAVILPDGRGFRLFDTSTGAAIRDLETPGYQHAAIHASRTGSGPRLVTISRDGVEDPALGPPGERRGGEGGPAPEEATPWGIMVWDLDRPEGPLARIEGSLPEESPFSQPLPLVAVSSDGGRIATAWSWNSVVSLWSAEDGASLGEIDVRTAVTALALGPSGVLAAAGSGGVRLWEIGTRTLLPILTTQLGHVRHLEFSPDGTLLAIAGYGADVELWDPAGASQVAALPTPDRVTGLVFAPDGSQLAVAMPESTALWAIVDSDVRIRMAQAEAPPRSLAFGADDWLALAFLDPAIAARLWRPFWSPSAVLPLEGITASGVAFDDRGRVVALDGDELLWFEPKSSCGERGHQPEPEHRVALPPPSEPDGEPSPTRSPQMTRIWQRLYSSPEGRRLVVLRSGPPQVPPQVLLWEADRPDHVLDLNPTPRGSADPSEDRGRNASSRPVSYSAVAVAPVGDPHNRVYLVQSRGGRLVAWSILRDGSVQVVGPELDYEVANVAVSADGSTLALALRDGGLVLVDARTGSVRRTLSDNAQVSTMAFSPSGDTLAVGGRDGFVELWDLRSTTTSPLRLTGHRGAVHALTFSQDGRNLASAGEDKAVEVWRLDRLRPELSRLGLGW